MRRSQGYGGFPVLPASRRRSRPVDPAEGEGRGIPQFPAEQESLLKRRERRGRVPEQVVNESPGSLEEELQLTSGVLGQVPRSFFQLQLRAFDISHLGEYHRQVAGDLDEDAALAGG